MFRAFLTLTFVLWTAPLWACNPVGFSGRAYSYAPRMLGYAPRAAIADPVPDPPPVPDAPPQGGCGSASTYGLPQGQTDPGTVFLPSAGYGYNAGFRTFRKFRYAGAFRPRVFLPTGRAVAVHVPHVAGLRRFLPVARPRARVVVHIH